MFSVTTKIKDGKPVRQVKMHASTVRKLTECEAALNLLAIECDTLKDASGKAAQGIRAVLTAYKESQTA